jgi:hypothetical protein
MARRKNKTNRDQPLAASHGANPRVVSPEPCESRLRPWLLCGMTAVLVARPLFPSESAAQSGDGLSVVMLWLALSVFWLLGAIGRRTFSLRLGWTDTAVLLLVAWTTISALWAVRYGTPRPAVNMLWEWIGLGMCFFLARQFIVTSRERRAIAAVMVALAVGISGYGLYQAAYELPQTEVRYKANPDQALRDAGLSFPAGSPERKAFEDRLANRLPMATFALANSLAAFLAPWAVMLVGVVGSSLRSRKRLLGMLICLAPIAACLVLTKSRSGYAGACLGILLAWWFGRERRIRLGWKLPAAVAGVAVLLLSAALVVEGSAVLGRASKSFGYRLQYWQSSLEMIAAHPWLGCGPGNFQDIYTQYKLPEASEEIADPHNLLLEMWATAGTPAVLAFLAVLACFAVGSRGQAAGGRVQGREFGETREAGRVGGVPRTPCSQSPFSGPQSAISDLKSQISDSVCDGWLHILAGGLLGFLLSIPLGMLSAAPSSIAAVAIGLPLAVAAIALMFRWIREGRLPQWLPGVCVVVILVVLFAAGGIAMPAVAASFWLLLALGLEGRRKRLLPASAAWAALAGFVALAVACYGTAYEPVLHCQAELRLAERQFLEAAEHRARAATAEPVLAIPLRELARQESARAVAHLEAAAAADPLSAEPWRQLAAVEFEEWSRQPEKAAFDRFTRAKNEAITRARHSSDLWMAVGDWESRAFATEDQSEDRAARDAIRSAIEAYSHAMALYPNSALSHAKLAEAYLSAGDRQAFDRESEAALRLDRVTPHADKKLPTKLRERLRAGLQQSQ